jgi:hypothetical protein
MYNQEELKKLFKQMGIKCEIETTEIYQKCFILKVDRAKNTYFWDNEIVTKEEYYNNLQKIALTKN